MTRKALSPLARELRKQTPFATLEQEAFLSILRTASRLEGDFEKLFRPEGLSLPTYNVLRVLRSAGEEGCACREIGERMVTRVPDVTRLLDRLELQGYVERSRTETDRRVVTTRITRAGLSVLARLDEPTLELHARQIGHLSKVELKSLCGLLAKARGVE